MPVRRGDGSYFFCKKGKKSTISKNKVFLMHVVADAPYSDDLSNEKPCIASKTFPLETLRVFLLNPTSFSQDPHPHTHITCNLKFPKCDFTPSFHGKLCLAVSGHSLIIPTVKNDRHHAHIRLQDPVEHRHRQRQWHGSLRAPFGVWSQGWIYLFRCWGE